VTPPSFKRKYDMMAQLKLQHGVFDSRDSKSLAENGVTYPSRRPGHAVSVFVQSLHSQIGSKTLTLSISERTNTSGTGASLMSYRVSFSSLRYKRLGRNS